ncbi:hypothetical protein HPB51_002472 [Rhipicephalus microplus]|uniref:Uncharacterized protein n=1 Tax=Rhipicephalus microplus TaxID=6941 RepID=A0A9J6DEW8_RHIMP|nr:hypothetical protein HPB51_002472 [Rhipicephalus microplus]
MCVAACASAPAGGTAAAGEPIVPSAERSDDGQSAAAHVSESSPSTKRSEAGKIAASSSPVSSGVSCDGDECADGEVGDECVKCRAQLRRRQFDSWRRSMSRFGVDLRRLLIHIEKPCFAHVERLRAPAYLLALPSSVRCRVECVIAFRAVKRDAWSESASPGGKRQKQHTSSPGAPLVRPPRRNMQCVIRCSAADPEGRRFDPGGRILWETKCSCVVDCGMAVHMEEWHVSEISRAPSTAACLVILWFRY